MTSDQAHLDGRLADAARRLQAEPDTQHTLESAVALATETIDGCDFAGVSIVHRKRQIDTPALTDEIVRRGDELQYELQQGPCLDAIWEQDTIRSPNLAEEKRWPEWAPRMAEELGVCSMLCLRLYTSADTLGGLNPYSSRIAAFDDDDVNTATFLAANIAVALAESQQAEQMHNAIWNRTVIGQAQGILMERFGMDPDRAFGVLRRVSQASNIKLNQVAAELVRTRRTPGGVRPNSHPGTKSQSGQPLPAAVAH